MMAVLAIVVAGTGAFFSDTETSQGNVFTAGSIDLKINHTMASYNGEWCGQSCEVPEGAANLFVNGSFEEPTVTDNNGSHQFFLPGEVPGWTVEEGTYLELQRDAFTSAEGEQHAELDGDGADPATKISQTLSTTPGQRYQLSFAWSPRPESQATGSGIEVMAFEVVGESGTNISDTVTTGTGPIGWVYETYEFVAIDSETTISFALAGPVNTYGGLLDDVRVEAMECTDKEYSETMGGFCELWESRDLTTEKFFEFYDVKPQDHGTNLISMTVEDNQSYLCLRVEKDEEESSLGTGNGDLGEYLYVLGWYSDGYGNNLGPAFGPTKANDFTGMTYADSTTPNSPITPGETQYLLLEWCYGEFEQTGDFEYSCSGDVPTINSTQNAQFMADLQFFAIQSRNNDGFTCDQATFGELPVVPGDGDGTDEGEAPLP